MIDLAAIKKAIADAVETATSLTVIYANQNAPRPEDNYASVYVTPSAKSGFDRVSYANNVQEDLDETIEGHRELKASINFFKEDAFTNASKFIAQLQGNNLIDFFKNNGLGFISVSEVRDISEVNKNLWEERAQLDLTFYALSNFSEDVNAVHEANVEGIAESGNNATNVNININNT